MRTLIISAVLALSPACSLFQSTERSEITQAPDAGTVNDGCHGSGDPLPDAGCCGQTLDAGGWNWPDGGPQDGGGYLPDGGWGSVDGGSWLPDGGP